jgi:hypothetical protein
MAEKQKHHHGPRSPEDARIAIKLVCWHCGESRTALVPHEPQFAFELVGWAKDVGMVGYFDMPRGRALIFCSPEHARNEMTKRGVFRLRPKGSRVDVGSDAD